MKLLYITSPSFFDADLSLVKALNNLLEITVLMDLPKHGLHQTALTINHQEERPGIMEVTEHKEFAKYKNYIKGDFFVINRPKSKLLSKETIIVNYQVKKFIKSINPDLIHYNNFCDLTYFSSLFNKHKKILTVHDPIPHIGESLRNLLDRRLNFLFLKKIIILNEFQRELFITRYKINNLNLFNSKLSVYDFYTDLYPDLNPDSNDNGLNILFFGRIAKYKGVNILIRSFQKMRKKIPQATLTIAGKGSFDFNTHDLNNIKIINRYVESEELLHLINKAAFVVCPYIEGTQSGVVMTAFSLCKPVIATNVGGLPEMVTHNKTGIIVKPNDIDELCNAMLELLNNPYKREVFSNNIQQLYFKNGNNSWDTIAKDLFLLYTQTIA